MRRIVGATVRKTATTNAREAQRLARNYGGARGNVRRQGKDFLIGRKTPRAIEAAQDLTVYLE